MMARRMWSILALALGLGAIVLAVVTAVSAFPRGLTVLACGILSVGAAWWAVLRRGAPRAVGLGAAVLLLCVAILRVIMEARVLEDLLVLAGIAGALAAARKAFEPKAELPVATRPARPVLFYNPLSGGGKAQRFHLVEEARRRGIATVELHRGDDLEQLVRTAVQQGADALAMAGGDGSQAIVAMIAAELGLPYACIPAGTRNHFALDLGVDRDDVVGALDAFVDGGERRVDLAEVNGRIFVNNVSLGLYADAVQRPGYREAKLHTLLDTVPEVLGPDARPAELRWGSGEAARSAVAILVSNNPYRLGRALGSGTRPRLDGAELGVAVLAPVASGRDGHPARRLAMRQWTAASCEIDAASPVAAGIDGEATHLDSPLRFSIRPGALRVRIARKHPGASPSSLEPDTPWRTMHALVSFAVRGEPPAASPVRSAGSADD